MSIRDGQRGAPPKLRRAELTRGGALMRKLRLKLDELAVEGFEVDTPPEERGTVEGRNQPCTHPQACPYTANWNCSVCACTQYPQYCP
jgi:hypothetical protein